NLGDVLISHPFKIPHYNNLAELLSQILQRMPEGFAVATPFQQHLRIRPLNLEAVDLLVEFGLVFVACTSFQARVAGVAHDREQPHTAVATAKAADKTERA